MFTVAVLAGGLATRLRPITERLPKSLVEVAGRPFLLRQLDWLRKEGAERVVLCVGYLGERVAELIGDGSAFGLSVDYSFDGDPLLGTGGALKKAVSKLGDAFFVLYGDSYLCCSFRDVQTHFEAAGKPALMTILKNDGRWDTSNVLYSGGQLLRYDKRSPSSEMQFIDYGLGVIRASVLQPFGEDEAFDLADVYSELSKRGLLAGYEVHERFYEIGSHAGLAEAEAFFRKKGEA